MSDTTSIADLPINPVNGGGQHNVVIETSDKLNQYNPNNMIPSSGSEITEQKVMNEVITGIQQANASGALDLPSRDIPTNTVHFADEATQPNYIPEKEQQDYIENTDTEQEIMARRMKYNNSRDSLEILYDEFQIPIIIGLLYFIIQLPVVKSKILTIIPSLFNSDGNPNLSGYIFNSCFFAILYYVISKALLQLQNI